MEHRKGFKNYMINGCRAAGNIYNRTLGDMSFQLGVRAALLGFAILTLNGALAALALLAPIFPQFSQNLGLKIAIKKDGLTGDNLKLVEDLEKRFTDLPDFTGMTKEQVELELRKIDDKVKEVTALDIAKLKEMLGEDEKGVRSILKAQADEIAKLKGLLATPNEDAMSIRSQIAKWQETNKDAIAKIKGGAKVDLPVLEIRAANSPMTPANTLTNTITVNAGVVPQFEAGIHDVRRIQPTFWDYINKGRTSSAAYTWVNKKVPADSGAAAFIGPGVAKPGVSFTLEREVSNAKKIAVSDKLAIELLDDVDGMDSYVRNEMTYQLRQKINTTLMTGVLSSTVPAGIQTFSVAYSLAGVSTPNPNNFDVIRAVVAQLSVGFFQGLPVTVFINPVDAANMDLTKAVSQGTYLLPPFSTADGRRVAGAIVVEDNNVAAGYFQAACLDLFKNLIYKDMVINLGWENDDFTKNLVTYICEMRLHSFHSDNDAGAFIYDTFANVKELIAEAEV